MKRDMHYRTKTLKQLINCYADETNRINQKDRELSKRLIVNEVYARVKETFDLLDAEPDAADQIYKQLIEF